MCKFIYRFSCVCQKKVVPLQPILKIVYRRDGGIGRHEGLKILWPVMAVPVRPRLAVHKKSSISLLFLL